jgi:hypothetical protein
MNIAGIGCVRARAIGLDGTHHDGGDDGGRKERGRWGGKAKQHGL